VRDFQNSYAALAHRTVHQNSLFKLHYSIFVPISCRFESLYHVRSYHMQMSHGTKGMPLSIILQYVTALYLDAWTICIWRTV